MEILYSDKNIIVCIKPIGFDSEKQMPAKLIDEFGGEIFTVHRLDLNVGGVMVYAREKKAAAYLSRMVQENRVVKEYLAVVTGAPLPPEGIWEDLLWKDSGKNKVFVVKRPRKGVKTAKLSYRVLHPGQRSLVRVRLFTGRSHQIRVQFSSRGCPLVGDHKYGSREPEEAPALWAYCLTFPHPETGRDMTLMKLPEGGVWAAFAKAMPQPESE